MTLAPEINCDPAAGLNNGKAILSEKGDYFCATECGKHGQNYNWCKLYYSWDYCDPNSQQGKEYMTPWPFSINVHFTNQILQNPRKVKGGFDYFQSTQN